MSEAISAGFTALELPHAPDTHTHTHTHAHAHGDAHMETSGQSRRSGDAMDARTDIYAYGGPHPPPRVRVHGGEAGISAIAAGSAEDIVADVCVEEGAVLGVGGSGRSVGLGTVGIGRRTVAVTAVGAGDGTGTTAGVSGVPPKSVIVEHPDGTFAIGYLGNAPVDSRTDPRARMFGGADDALSTPDGIRSALMRLQQMRMTVVALDSLQRERSNLLFASNHTRPLSRARIRTIALMFVDALYFIIQYFVLALTSGAVSLTAALQDENLVLPMASSVLIAAVGMTAVARGTAHLLTMYILVQAATIIVLVRGSYQMWLFLIFRAAALVGATHFRLTLARYQRAKERLDQIQQSAVAGRDAILSTIDAAIAAATHALGAMASEGAGGLQDADDIVAAPAQLDSARQEQELQRARLREALEMLQRVLAGDAIRAPRGASSPRTNRAVPGSAASRRARHGSPRSTPSARSPRVHDQQVLATASMAHLQLLHGAAAVAPSPSGLPQDTAGQLRRQAPAMAMPFDTSAERREWPPGYTSGQLVDDGPSMSPHVVVPMAQGGAASIGGSSFLPRPHEATTTADQTHTAGTLAFTTSIQRSSGTLSVASPSIMVSSTGSRTRGASVEALSARRNSAILRMRDDNPDAALRALVTTADDSDDRPGADDRPAHLPGAAATSPIPVHPGCVPSPSPPPSSLEL